MKVTRQQLFSSSHALMRVISWLLLLSLLLLTVAACGEGAPAASEGVLVVAAAGGDGEEAVTEEAPETADPGAAEVLPAFEPVTLAEGEKLRVVATTSIVADVARRVGGDAIELTTLMPLGTDPHS